MRDTLKNVEYWDRLIERYQKSAERRVMEVSSGNLPSHQHNAVASSSVDDFLCLISCCYSAGLDGFRKHLVTAVKMMDIGWDGGYLPRDRKKTLYHEYVQITFDKVLWCLSFAHLLEVEDEVFRTLERVIDRDHVTDVVLEFLLSARLKDRPIIKVDNYLFATNPVLYRCLRQAILEPDLILAAEALKVYVRQDWYRAHSGAGWYNTHKSDKDYYTGYWCWEAAAVVKLRGLDDSGFRDWKYYPKDMLTGLE